MGTWSVSITGNDTASDLKYEYTSAFFYYDVNEALQKIDAYVRKEVCDETDEEEWCNYIYSLANFMWGKGILTDEIRQQAIEMIDSGFGMEAWAESGEKVLLARKKVLEKFREKLLSAQPPKKKIKPNVNLNEIFDDGDLIAIQLQTAGKTYVENKEKPMSEEEFHSFNGKYILIQKIECFSSWSSSIVPEVKDYWAVFRLFNGAYDEVPYDVDIHSLKNAKVHVGHFISPLFICESSMFYFKKRKYQILGNYKEEVQAYLNTKCDNIFLGINREWVNPDSSFLASMGKETACDIYTGSIENLKEICRLGNIYGAFDYRLSREENEQNRRTEETIIYKNIEKTLSGGGVFYEVRFGRTVGVVSVLNYKIDNFYVEGRFQGFGFGTILLKYVIEQYHNNLYIDVPKKDERLMHICEKLELTLIEDINDACVRMKG